MKKRTQKGENPDIDREWIGHVTDKSEKAQWLCD